MLSTPSLKGSKLPNGHILLNHKFKGTPLSKEIFSSGLRLLYEDTLGFIDSFPTSDCAVIIAYENIVVSQVQLDSKLKQLLKYSKKKVILFEVTPLSEQYLAILQRRLIDNDSDASLVPIGNEREAAMILCQLNQFEKDFTFAKMGSIIPSTESSLLQTVSSFQGVGGKKANELLKKFSTLKNILQASVDDLAVVVGEQTAKMIKTSVN